MELRANTGNHRGGVFAWGGKTCGKAQMATKRSLCRRKTKGELEEGLQIFGAGRESPKRPTLVVDKKPNGKCQLKSKKEHL